MEAESEEDLSEEAALTITASRREALGLMAAERPPRAAMAEEATETEPHVIIIIVVGAIYFISVRCVGIIRTYVAKTFYFCCKVIRSFGFGWKRCEACARRVKDNDAQTRDSMSFASLLFVEETGRRGRLSGQQ